MGEGKEKATYIKAAAITAIIPVSINNDINTITPLGLLIRKLVLLGWVLPSQYGLSLTGALYGLLLAFSIASFIFILKV